MAGTKISAGSNVSSLLGTEKYPLFQVGQGGSDKLTATTDQIRAYIAGTVPKTVGTSTYTFLQSDNGKTIIFTAECTATVPAGLSSDWNVKVYRDTGAGLLTLDDDGTTSLKGAGFTIDYEETGATLEHIGSNVFLVLGAVGADQLVTSVAVTQPAAGFTITGGPITSSGTFVFALSDDLAAVEGINSTGAVRRTGSNTWTAGTLPVTEGGTGLITIAALSIPVANALNTYTTVTPGAGQSIRVNAGGSAWEAFTPGSGGGWATTGDTPLTGATTITTTTTNTLEFRTSGLGTTVTDGAGLVLSNTTAASSGNQQISGVLTLRGNGWKTTATAASQPVEWAMYTLPIQGTTNPSEELTFASSINNGSYNIRYRFSETGKLTLQNGSSTIDFDPTANGNIGTNGIMTFTTNGVPKITLSSAGDWSMFQSVGTSGARTGFTFTAAAHTGQTASTDIPSVLYDLSATRQFATGAKTVQREFRVRNPTYGAVGSSTISDAYTFYLDGAPIAGTNVTITRGWAAGFNGNVQFIGKTVWDATITSGGTTGNQTINKPAGTVNFAAAATTITVTNSFCTTSSLVFCEVRTNDTTAVIKNVVPGSGSFVITLGAAATAETSVGFLVIN